MQAMPAIKVELHMKLGWKEPYLEGVELEQVLSDDLVDLLVSGRGIS